MLHHLIRAKRLEEVDCRVFSSDWLYLYVRAHGCLALERQLAEAKDALREEVGGEEEGGLADRAALVCHAVTL